MGALAHVALGIRELLHLACLFRALGTVALQVRFERFGDLGMGVDVVRFVHDRLRIIRFRLLSGD